MFCGKRLQKMRSRGLPGRANCLRFGLAFALATVAFTGSANAWWNQDWSMRKQITVDTSSTGANITDPIGSVPLLIRLHVGNFRFASAKPDGSDLRFVAGDDKTPLKHHVEKFDSLLGEALVWVNVPNVQPGAKTDIWLYYGNQKIGPANDAKGTYDPDTLLVYHFVERGTPSLDSTAWANNAQSVAQPADGAIIGSGLRLTGVAPLTLPASSSLAFSANAPLSMSFWTKPATLQPNAVIYSRRDSAASNGLIIGLDNGVPFVEVINAAAVQRASGSAVVAQNSWHQFAVIAGNGQITLYVDGAPAATMSAGLPALNTIARIGSDTATSTVAPATPPSATAQPDASTAPGADGAVALAPAGPSADAPVAEAASSAPTVTYPGFIGDLDELHIDKVARPAGFVRFQAINQGPEPSKLLTLSVDEETASWFSGYFGVLLKAVTIDGWIVIIILMVMALASWVVMVEKHRYLKRQKQGNDVFVPAFRRLDNDLTRLSDGAAFQADESANAVADKSGLKRNTRPKDATAALRHSAINRIYLIGADEIRRRFPGDATGGTHVLSAEAIAAIRSALDAGLVRELQALNRLMVILTISISGGPFLGLLGTVIGVMVTFAAIAMSGDVNINAIAPGIAGALMATVAGLAVAIPALFGYNWLTLRIKDLTSDMQVFVDEFTTKMAEVYSSDRPSPALHRIAAE
jgi:biopolymer transport protein ExbB